MPTDQNFEDGASTHTRLPAEALSYGNSSGDFVSVFLLLADDATFPLNLA